MSIRDSSILSATQWFPRVILIVSLTIPMLAVLGLLQITDISAELNTQLTSPLKENETYTLEFHYYRDDPADAATKAGIFASLMSQETGLDIDASINPCGLGVVQRLGRGDVTMSPLLAAAYVQEHDEYGFEARLANVRFGSTGYRGQLNIRADKNITDVWSLQGKTFAATSPWSTTSYLAPYTMFSDTTGIAPEDFFGEIIFTDNHRDVIADVYNGVADVGGTYEDARVLITSTYTDVLDVVSVFTYTEYLRNDPWVFTRNLSPTVTQSLVDGLVAVGSTDAGQEALIPFVGQIDGMAPITDSDYDFTRSVLDYFGPFNIRGCFSYLPFTKNSGE